jgi:hypothetical protein
VWTRQPGTRGIGALAAHGATSPPPAREEPRAARRIHRARGARIGYARAVIRVVAPGLALLAACFSPEPPAGAPCAAQQRCPASLACIAGVCQPPGPTGDGPAGDGALGPDGALVCPAGFTKMASGACHLDVFDPLTWPEAELGCEQRGAHLVVPGDVAEAMELAAPRWIGVTDRIVEGTFRAVTGEIAAFTFWDIGEPSGVLTSCAHTGFDGRWSAGPCEFPFPYACEYDGRPVARDAF